MKLILIATLPLVALITGIKIIFSESRMITENGFWYELNINLPETWYNLINE
jgi:hypothetical protein